MKKLMAIILALVVLALPVASLADGDFISEAVANGRSVERVTTLKMMEIGDESVDQLVGSLLDVISVVTYWQEADGVQTGLQVNMDGKDILSIDVAGADETVYLRSNLLKGDIIAVAPQDVEAIAEKVLKTMVAEQLIDEEDVENAMEQMRTAMADASNSMANVDFEAVMTGFDFSALQLFSESVVAERLVEQSDLSGLPEGSDPAVAAMTMNLTADDIIQVYDAFFDAIKNNKEYLALLDTMVVSVNDQPMSAEDAVNEMQKQLHEGLSEVMEGDIPVTIYINANEEVVAATCEMAMKGIDDTSGETLPIKAYVKSWRSTEDEQVTYTMDYTIEAGDELMANASMLMVTSGNDIDAMLSITDEDGVVVLGFQKTENVTDTERSVDAVVAMSFGTNEGGWTNSASSIALTVDIDGKKNGVDAEQTTVVTLSLNGGELASMTTVSKTGEPKDSIATEEAIRLAELSQEDFQTWFEGVMTTLQIYPMTLLQALPTDVLMMLME